MSVGKIAPFVINKDNWDLYVERLEQYFIANAVSETVKVATLITVVGSDAYELMVNLCTPARPATKTFEQLKAIMKAHLQPKPSVLAARFKFRRRFQAKDESIAEFAAALKKMSMTCNFADADRLSENIRDQFICGLSKEVIRQRLFAEEEIAFDKAFKLAMTIDTAEADAAVMEKSGESTGVYRVTPSSTRGSNEEATGGRKVSGATREWSGSARAGYSRGGRRGASGMGATGASRGRGAYSGAGACKACGGHHDVGTCKFKAYVCRVCNRDGHLKRMCPRLREERLFAMYDDGGADERVAYGDSEGDSDEAEGAEIHLDEEMDRVVWGEGQREPLDARYRATTEPRRDSAAPVPPDADLTPEGLGWSSSETEPLHSTTSPSQTTSASSASPREDGDRHVQFGGPPGTPEHSPPASDESDLRREQRTARLHHRHQGRKYSLQEGARGGTEKAAAPDRPPEPRISIPDEEMAEVDADELASHRTDDPKGLRRHLIHQPKDASTVHVGRRDGGDRLNSLINDKKLYDHSPHSVFVQLDELLATNDGDAEWKETARWIKYEEDVEEDAARWGRPHVASLSFHSLLNLRRCLETGVVLLDLEERDLPGVAYRVVERMVDDGLIEEDDKPVVMRSLLLRHRHVHDDRFRFSIGRKHTSYTSLQNLADPRRRRSSYAIPLDKQSTNELRKKMSTAGSEKIDLKEVEYTVAGSQDELRRGHNDAILKRIPGDAEATTVLVGGVGFLDQPTIAFVRLAQGILMPSITEVPIPVRFMFILLGPVTAELDYHEVGRSISTLMSNPAFHRIAYKADDRRDLLSAINEFLDDSIVLPPGDWERQALLPMEELRAKSEMIRRRKANAIEKKRASIGAGAGAVTLSEEKQALLRMETAGLPPKEPEGPLERTGRLFGGVIRDIKRRYPFYVSDITDALNGQCLAATIFMYFAAVSSAITFGGLLATKTDTNIGITETLLFTCFGGMFFALLSGQPMMITGATGPLLLLDESLFSFCKSYGFDFLAARMYCGLWMIVIALLVASVEGSVAVKKITRFTEDIFAFLISLIFIGEPVTSLINVYRAHPLGIEYAMYGHNITAPNNVTVNGTGAENATVWGPPLLPPYPAPQPNTALWCTILTLSTFIIAYYLRIFRNGKYLGRSARRALGDFGVPIAIVLMVGMASLVPVYTDKLNVPEGLDPSLKSGRNWLVMLNPGINTIPAWATFAMALPALMVYIIVFMETHIAELIIDKPERRLKKGSGFHMDIVIMSFVNCVCGVFGAPWQCVATVRSVAHVSALTVMSTTHAPGDKPHIVEVKEQRVTGFLVAVMVGLSVLASKLLTLVPMAVLFGVFLYMGISALGGIQFWDRCILLLKPVKHHAQVPYVRRVPTWKMHMYTLVQIAGILLLFTVKSSRFSLALPFFLVLMVPLRMSLAYVFTPLQLRALDGAQKEIDDDEPDFYQEAPLP